MPKRLLERDLEDNLRARVHAKLDPRIDTKDRSLVTIARLSYILGRLDQEREDSEGNANASELAAYALRLMEIDNAAEQLEHDSKALPFEVPREMPQTEFDEFKNVHSDLSERLQVLCNRVQSNPIITWIFCLAWISGGAEAVMVQSDMREIMRKMRLLLTGLPGVKELYTVPKDQLGDATSIMVGSGLTQGLRPYGPTPAPSTKSPSNSADSGTA
jgi:hypothetical protein